jgi:hypothetical protein
MKNIVQIISTAIVLFLFNSLHAQEIPSIQWQKSLGGSDDDEAYSIQQTTDGGYIVAGRTGSNDFDVTGNHGGNDYWILKIDSAGIPQESRYRPSSAKPTNTGGLRKRDL